MRGFTKFFFKQILKVSAFYLEKQKSFIPKKNFFFVNINTKKLCLPTQFSVKVLVLCINCATMNGGALLCSCVAGGKNVHGIPKSATVFTSPPNAHFKSYNPVGTQIWIIEFVTKIQVHSLNRSFIHLCLFWKLWFFF